MQKNYGLDNFAPAFVLEVRESLNQAGRGSDSQPCLCSVNSGGKTGLMPAELIVPMCVIHSYAKLCGWYTGCLLGNGMEKAGFLGTFSVHCAVPSWHFTNHHKEDDKKGEKNLKINCVSLPSLSQQPWQTHRSQARLVSAGCYSLQNFMVILGSSYDRMVKAQEGKSGLSAFISGSATKILSDRLTCINSFGCPIGMNFVLCISYFCFF